MCGKQMSHLVLWPNLFVLVGMWWGPEHPALRQKRTCLATNKLIPEMLKVINPGPGDGG